MADFFNQATLSYNGVVTNSNTTRGCIAEMLTVTKTAVLSEYTKGDVVSYVVNIVNAGETAYRNVKVKDNLGEYTDGEDKIIPLDYVDGSAKVFVNGVLQSGVDVYFENGLEISGVTLSCGVTTIVYSARVNDFADIECGREIVNTAEVSGNGFSAVYAESRIKASEKAVLSIEKSLSPINVTENGQVTYTFVIRNSGNSPVTASDDAVITDVFTPAIEIQSVMFNGEAWNENVNYRYTQSDDETAVFESILGELTVPAASCIRNPVTKTIVVESGISTLVIVGTIR